ncbi:MAG: ribonuclease D [Lentisphaeria bacterium]
MTLWIDNDADFSALCREAAQHPCIALDTEFIWSSTFYPRLALVQLSWGREHCALIDPQAIQNPAPLGELLENPHVRKILHEAPSDLPILRNWCGAPLPAAIFDTRLAAAFCGLSLSCSLNKLLTELLQITLDKSETRSDWLQRPLTDKQLQYASEDVIMLPELALQLEDRIKTFGNLACFEEEMILFSRPDFYRLEEPENCWQRIGGSGNFDARRLAILRELAAWREMTARELDKPRPRILKDEQVLAITTLLPQTLADLRKIPEFWPKHIQKYGESILAAIQRGQHVPLEDCPSPQTLKMSVQVYRKRVARLQALVKKRCEPRGLDPSLVAPRREISSLVQAAEKGNWINHSLMHGWRAELLGDTLRTMIKNNFEE